MIFSVKDHVEVFEPAFLKLEESGAWRMLNRKVIPDYIKNREGLLFSFQKKT